MYILFLYVMICLSHFWIGYSVPSLVLILFPLVDIVLITLFIYGVLKKKYLQRKFKLNFRKYFLYVSMFVVCLSISSFLYNRFLGLERYEYRYAQLLPNYSILFHHEFTQTLYGEIYRLFPVEINHILNVVEDSVSVFLAKSAIESGICLDETDCFLKLYKKQLALGERTPTFQILMVASGATILFKQKKESYKKLGKNHDQLLILKLMEIGNLSLKGNYNFIVKLLQIDDGKKHREDMLQMIKKYSKTVLKKNSNLKKELIGKEVCEISCQENALALEKELIKYSSLIGNLQVK